VSLKDAWYRIKVTDTTETNPYRIKALCPLFAAIERGSGALKPDHHRHGSEHAEGDLFADIFLEGEDVNTSVFLLLGAC
jgi:hypothetical protein